MRGGENQKQIHFDYDIEQVLQFNEINIQAQKGFDWNQLQISNSNFDFMMKNSCKKTKFRISFQDFPYIKISI